MRKFKILLLFQLFSVLIYAQDRTITGTITSVDGELLPGATVIEKGTSNGTSTDFDGNYQITVPQNGDVILEFSYHIAYDGKTPLDFTMSPLLSTF